MAASKTAQSWNRGLVGEPKPPRAVQTATRCTTTGCGAQPGGVRRHPGWVLIEVVGSTEPKRLFCSWDCAAYGSALAELRVGGAR
ncbi:hypothetical protein [Streptomyces griseus]|uniref:hypothetical protein n=1 Tax=Streptomyces griseus TaxID=1911 RepID=UPI0004C74CFA|nr:hypothetical protein [Streptomyces griseus]